jgi:erythromycin esterase
MGFDTLAIEASCSAAERLNGFVLHGAGDLSSGLAGLGSVMWNVEEFVETLKWLRAHNESVADERKVSFVGVDIFHTSRSRSAVLSYLSKVAPRYAAAAARVFGDVAVAEARGWLLAHEGLGEGDFSALQDLQAAFQQEEQVMVVRSSREAYQHALMHLEIIRQWMIANGAGDGGELTRALPRMAGLNNYTRSLYLAENLLRIIRSRPEARIVLWAHNFHVGVGFEHVPGETMPNMGWHLRRSLGEHYYACALELNQGEYLSREWAVPGKTLGELTHASVGPAPHGSLPWLLALIGEPAFMLDFSSILAESDVGRWSRTPQLTYCLGWAHNDPPIMTRIVPATNFDGLIFVRTTTPTTPTAHAMDMVARGAGH